MAYSKRTDATQAAIVAALRQVGCSVQDLSKVGQGVPDLLVSRMMPCPFCETYRASNILMECKSAHGRLNELQVNFHTTWRGPIMVVRSVEEALKSIGVE